MSVLRLFITNYVDFLGLLGLNWFKSSFTYRGIYIPTYIFYNSISLLYNSIVFTPNLLWYFHNKFSVHSSDDLRALVQYNQFPKNLLPM